MTFDKGTRPFNGGGQLFQQMILGKSGYPQAKE